jgi:hypothetical protein
MALLLGDLLDGRRLESAMVLPYWSVSGVTDLHHHSLGEKAVGLVQDNSSQSSSWR